MFFKRVRATEAERAAARPGDDIVAPADVVMDRAFTAAAGPEQVWPWLVQLGKARAGWYLPGSVERVLPRSRRAIRVVDPAWQGLAVWDVIPDYGGKDETFEVVAIDPPRSIVYRSRRGRVELTWSISVEGVEAAAGEGPVEQSRVFLRLRMAPVRHRWLANTVGELFDALTIAGMAAGLNERLGERGQPPGRPR